MFTIIIRATIIFFIVLVVIRLMGKRQLGEMQPFELVVTLIISEIACIPMSDPSIPLYYGIVPILLLFVAHFVISAISRKSIKFRAVIDGRSVVVINPNGVDYESLKSLNMTVNDLLEATNNAGYFDLSDIYYASFETNGKLSVIPTSFATPATCGDLKIDRKQTSPPLCIVIDGKPLNLNKASVTEERLQRIIADAGLKRIKEIALIIIDYNGKCYIQPKDGTFVTKTYPDLAGGSW
ncbi:MAG: DUF421 domain-containing protein [Clostridiales bacterium]|jgi:uncharacterized membrane protein YcaP (DUF421 family)|nr:DUF421 domain-containing protein [Clostridiales bacterium]